MAEKESEAYLLGTPSTLADIFAVVEPSQDLLNGLLLLSGLLEFQTLTTHSGLLLLVLESLLDELNILESQLLADDVQITHRVDIALDVDNLGIIEASDDLENGIYSTDVRQEGITKTGTGRGTTGQTGDIVDSQVGGNHRLGLVLFN